MCRFHRSDLNSVSRDSNPTTMAIRAISGHFPDLLIACDVCLCPYTDHGHCGIFRPDNYIDNERSIAQIAAISRKFVEAGAHVIAPSGTSGRAGAFFLSPATLFPPKKILNVVRQEVGIAQPFWEKCALLP